MIGVQDIKAAAPLAVQALQQWYGADRHSREVGLYSYANPALAVNWRDWHSLSQIGRNLVNTALALSGRRDSIQNMSRWWNSANAITAVIGYMAATGDRSYLAPVVENTFTKAPDSHRPVKSRPIPFIGGKANAYPGFINGFYDDEGWWALAWLDAYDLTGDQKYLAAADEIFKDMIAAWDDVLGGGIYWGKYNGSPDKGGVSAIPRGWTGHPYKNAIANELFISLAAGLALRYRRRDPAGTDAAGYQQWAVRCWDWFSSPPPHGVAMINEAGLVNDSPNKQGRNDNTESVWSYNQGVILAGLADLTELTGDAGYLGWAEKVADAFVKNPWYVLPQGGKRPPPIQSGVINGILHEHNDCNPDGSGPLKSGVLPGVDTTMFKGIFVRNLARLYLRTKKESYAQFILANAESALRNKNERHQFGGNWAAAPDAADFVRQTSALDLINAALLVSG